MDNIAELAHTIVEILKIFKGMDITAITKKLENSIIQTARENGVTPDEVYEDYPQKIPVIATEIVKLGKSYHGMGPVEIADDIEQKQRNPLTAIDITALDQRLLLFLSFLPD